MKHETSEECLHYPVHNQTWAELLTALPKRIVGLISKLIGVKMFLFFVATAMLLHPSGAFPWYAWLVVYIATMFGWDGIKWIEAIKK